MPGQPLHTEALVLLKQPPTDRFQQFTVFAPAHGILLCLQRVSTKSTPTSQRLDLFDEAELFLESSNQGRTWFIKEARLRRRHTAIGGSYDGLRLASSFARIIVRNPVGAESRVRLGGLVRRTLGAFDGAARPDLVYLKSLYCFARDEGYPVKQQWWQNLPPAERAIASEMLNRPLAEQTALPGAVAGVIHQLEDYLRGHTEILLE
ncbi:MAG: hypothetical protein A3G75_13240 [Verrucomicrobia bacterium RIFCSPLOWO2_12_FULL_64_8]|nr:MAG: hypothetical protein A3G75_13240 [Verrucomicrobia bacterium RIFCSPLOWO2_12_FULL_64_8]